LQCPMIGVAGTSPAMTAVIGSAPMIFAMH
jgi:hypothetical protein